MLMMARLVSQASESPFWRAISLNSGLKAVGWSRRYFLFCLNRKSPILQSPMQLSILSLPALEQQPCSTSLRELAMQEEGMAGRVVSIINLRCQCTPIQLITTRSMPKKPRDYELDMSTLSSAQKLMCVRLLAESNVNFQQQENKFIAQFKVDPSTLHEISNRKEPRSSCRKEQCYQNGKKPLGRVVKVNNLSTLESLHGFVEVYIYAKRMPLTALQELIEGSYEKFWQHQRAKIGKAKEKNFAEWLYFNVIRQGKEKLKIEQTLVNLIDSLNHFAIKSNGVKLYLKFLSGDYGIDTLSYFLVLRGLLQQLLGERILEKNAHFKSGHQYKLKMNPYEKCLYQETITEFLEIIYSDGLRYCNSNSVETTFEALTKNMYYDEAKRKNFIDYFDLMEHLLSDFAQQSNRVSHPSCSEQSETLLFEESKCEQESKYESEGPRGQAPSCLKYDIPLIITEPAPKPPPFRLKFRSEALSAVESIHAQLHLKPSATFMDRFEDLLRAVTECDKALWCRNEIVREEEILYLQKLQQMYREREASGLMMQDLVRRLLMMPGIRECIADEMRL